MDPSFRKRFIEDLLRPQTLCLFLLLVASFALSMTFPVQGDRNIKAIGDFGKNLLEIMPAVLIIMGVLSVWITSDMVEKYMGAEAGFKGTIACLVFGVLSSIPIFMAFPMGRMLYSKKARLSSVYVFFGALAFPITTLLVEVQFMGLKWTLTRLGLSIPLVIVAAYIGERLYSRAKFGKPIPEDQ